MKRITKSKVINRKKLLDFDHDVWDRAGIPSELETMPDAGIPTNEIFESPMLDRVKLFCLLRTDVLDEMVIRNLVADFAESWAELKGLDTNLVNEALSAARFFPANRTDYVDQLRRADSLLGNDYSHSMWPIHSALSPLCSDAVNGMFLTILWQVDGEHREAGLSGYEEDYRERVNSIYESNSFEIDRRLVDHLFWIVARDMSLEKVRKLFPVKGLNINQNWLNRKCVKFDATGTCLAANHEWK